MFHESLSVFRINIVMVANDLRFLGSRVRFWGLPQAGAMLLYLTQVFRAVPFFTPRGVANVLITLELSLYLSVKTKRKLIPTYWENIRIGVQTSRPKQEEEAFDLKSDFLT